MIIEYLIKYSNLKYYKKSKCKESAKNNHYILTNHKLMPLDINSKIINLIFIFIFSLIFFIVTTQLLLKFMNNILN